MLAPCIRFSTDFSQALQEPYEMQEHCMSKGVRLGFDSAHDWRVVVTFQVRTDVQVNEPSVFGEPRLVPNLNILGDLLTSHQLVTTLHQHRNIAGLPCMSGTFVRTPTQYDLIYIDRVTFVSLALRFDSGILAAGASTSLAIAGQKSAASEYLDKCSEDLRHDMFEILRYLVDKKGITDFYAARDWDDGTEKV